MPSPIAINKIGYRLEQAADFVGMKPTKFLSLVKDGRMPEPAKIDGCVVWDGRKLVDCFDKLCGIEVSNNDPESGNPNERKLKSWD